ncbi:MAG TPA: hypothetical protein VGL95_14775 [Acetobacteraceae bacterium]|jgi:outer membrane murein-binding lipoprotein Lpp
MTARGDAAPGRAFSWGEVWAALAIVTAAVGAGVWVGGSNEHTVATDDRLTAIEHKVDTINTTVTEIKIAVARLALERHAEGTSAQTP